MADRSNFFFRQKVTADELTGEFTNAETSTQRTAQDPVITGIYSGLAVIENTIPDLNVLVGSGVAYSRNGERIGVGTQQTVDVSVDENLSSTAPGGGNSRVISVFIEFERLLSDARTDGNGANVFFSSAESFKLLVRQGSDAATPAPGAEETFINANGPAIDPGLLLLADIIRDNGQVAIANADIFEFRREFTFDLTSGALKIQEGTITGALQEMLDIVNATATGAAGKLVFGDASDGNVTITAGTTTLTRSMNYDTLTITSTGILEPEGYFIRAKVLDLQVGGIVRYNGVVGEDGAPGGNSQGGGNPDITFSTREVGKGGWGGEGDPAGGPPDDDGQSVEGFGGNGGSGGGTGALENNEGTVDKSFGDNTNDRQEPRHLAAVMNGYLSTGSTGAGDKIKIFEGGAGGGGGLGASGVDSGGGGKGGGVIIVLADSLTHDGVIQSIGGDGGDAGAVVDAGGGGGGGGGVIVLVSRVRAGAGTFSVAGGTGGTKIGSSVDGANGLVGLVLDLAQ